MLRGGGTVTEPKCNTHTRWRRRTGVGLVTLFLALAWVPSAIAAGAGLPLHLGEARSAPRAFTVALDRAADGSDGLDLDGSAREQDGAPPYAQSVSPPTAADAALASPPMPSISGFPTRIWRDLGALATRPLHLDRCDLERLALGAGVVAAVAGFDNRIRDSVQSHSTTGRRDFASRIRPLGMWDGVAVMGVLLGAGEVLGDARMAATGADGLEASLFSVAIVTPLLQTIVGRSRPREGRGSRQFAPFSGGSSFPSGEATETFTLAAVASSHTESLPLRALAWGLAGLVGWERMELDAHWASDVVAGALVGSAIGTWVSHRDAQAGAQHHALVVTPLAGPGVAGIAAAIEF